MESFNWYAIVSITDPLEQGDLLDNFPVVTLSEELSEIEPTMETRSEEEPEEKPIEAPVKEYRVIVMTQSCDLVKFTDSSQVIVCPLYDLREAKTSRGDKLDNANGWGKLIRGNYVGLHLLNKSDLQDHEFNYQVVDLQRIFSAPLSLIKQVAANQGDRVRLLPPYREHLAQAFARQFMRVGLPIDLPRRYPG